MKIFKRIPYVFLALIPASIGILAMVNNITDYNPTIEKIIIPMFTMSNVTNVTAKAMR